MLQRMKEVHDVVVVVVVARMLHQGRGIADVARLLHQERCSSVTASTVNATSYSAEALKHRAAPCLKPEGFSRSGSCPRCALPRCTALNRHALLLIVSLGHVGHRRRARLQEVVTSFQHSACVIPE